MNALKPGSDDEPVVKSSDDEPVVKKKSNTRNLKIALGLAAVILIPTIGSTLAQSIDIGTLDRVEFGQGVATIVSCQNAAISIQPTVKLSGGVFYLDTIVVSDILADRCTGIFFTFRVVNDGNNTVEISSDDVLGCRIEVKDPISASVGTAGCALDAFTAGGFTITPTITRDGNGARVHTVLASSVVSITVETSTV